MGRRHHRSGYWFRLGLDWIFPFRALHHHEGHHLYWGKHYDDDRHGKRHHAGRRERLGRQCGLPRQTHDAREQSPMVERTADDDQHDVDLLRAFRNHGG